MMIVYRIDICESFNNRKIEIPQRTCFLKANYLPQTKFAKVMFLHVSVILSTGGWGLPQCMLGYQHLPPRAQTPPPPGTRHPLCAVHAGRYGQRAGGMHHTGMQSCYYLKFHNAHFKNVALLSGHVGRCLANNNLPAWNRD